MPKCVWCELDGPAGCPIHVDQWRRSVAVAVLVLVAAVFAVVMILGARI